MVCGCGVCVQIKLVQACHSKLWLYRCCQIYGCMGHCCLNSLLRSTQVTASRSLTWVLLSYHELCRKRFPSKMHASMLVVPQIHYFIKRHLKFRNQYGWMCNLSVIYLIWCNMTVKLKILCIILILILILILYEWERKINKR